MTERVYYQPLGFVSGAAGRQLNEDSLSLPLKGGPLYFTHLQIIKRTGNEAPLVRTVRVGSKQNLSTLIGVEAVASLTERPQSKISHLLQPGVPTIMGILNVTPDSFSDGGAFLEPDSAAEHAKQMQSDGAAIIDIGGESTRPGAYTIDAGEELERVAPIIERCLTAGVETISIDTRKAHVMSEATRLGAHMINDVSALTFDPDAISVAARTGVPVVLMHAQGTPQTMQDRPHYQNVVLDVYDYLSDRIAACNDVGIEKQNVIVDPGIGFGKSPSDNLALLNNLSVFHGLGCPILLGASRKSFIAKIDREGGADSRIGGSLAAVAAAFNQGIELVRVHDVAQTRQFLTLQGETRGRDIAQNADEESP